MKVSISNNLFLGDREEALRGEDYDMIVNMTTDIPFKKTY